MERDPLTGFDGAARFMSKVVGGTCTGENPVVIPKALAASVALGEGLYVGLGTVVNSLETFNSDVGPENEVSPGPASVLDFKDFAVKRISNVFEGRVQPSRDLLQGDELLRSLCEQASLLIQDFVGLIRREAHTVVRRLSKKVKMPQVGLDENLRFLESIESDLSPDVVSVSRSAQDQMQAHSKHARNQLMRLRKKLRRLLDSRLSALSEAELLCGHPGNLLTATVVDAFRKLEDR